MNQRGATLLETLVAVTLLSLLGAAAAGGVRFGASVWERGAGAQTAAVDLRLTERVLRRQIAAAVPVRRDGASLTFDGAPDSLSFHAPLATRDGGALMLVTLTGGDDLRLTLDDDLTPEPRVETLLDGPHDLRFRYFGPLRPGAPPVWRTAWRAQTRLPQLVEVTLTPSGGPPRPIAIRLDRMR